MEPVPMPRKNRLPALDMDARIDREEYERRLR